MRQSQHTSDHIPNHIPNHINTLEEVTTPTVEPYIGMAKAKAYWKSYTKKDVQDAIEYLHSVVREKIWQAAISADDIL